MVTKQLIKKALSVAVLAAASGFAMQAAAAPIFSFTEVGGFVGGDVANVDYSGAVGGPGAPAAGPLFSTMSWFTGLSTQSSLTLTTVGGGGTAYAGGWQTISTLAHTNNPINGIGSWGPQDVWGRFVLTDSDGGAQVVVDDEELITISLTETSNNTGPCNPATNLIGTTCDDFFTFFPVSFSDIEFQSNDGNDWRAEFQFANFVNSALTPGGELVTGENRTSTVDIQVRLVQLTGVPEPESLTVLGLGLIGLGLASRRKQKKA